METTSTTTLRQPPSPFSESSQAVDFSPLEFFLALIAVITIPALIYTFFFSIKCPPNPFRRRRRSSGRFNSSGGEINGADFVMEVKYEKESNSKEIGSECPVCLSVFADGEEIKQLSSCKHSFHASCIDIWLNSHSNCPICRASVPAKQPSGVAVSTRNDDAHQGLPDAASLV